MEKIILNITGNNDKEINSLKEVFNNKSLDNYELNCDKSLQSNSNNDSILINISEYKITLSINSLNSISLNKPVKFISILTSIDKLLDINKKKITTEIKIQNILINTTLQKAIIDNKEIDLTEKEISIITHLYNAPDNTISKQDLLLTIWGYSESIDTHTLESHIYKLRQKIEKDSSNPKIIITEKNGYKLIK